MAEIDQAARALGLAKRIEAMASETFGDIREDGFADMMATISLLAARRLHHELKESPQRDRAIGSAIHLFSVHMVDFLENPEVMDG